MSNYGNGNGGSNGAGQDRDKERDEKTVYFVQVPSDLRPRVGAIAKELQAAGFIPEIPWWGDNNTPDEADEEARDAMQKRNMQKLAMARYVVAVTDGAMPHPQTYVEIGAALGYKKHVLWTVERGGRSIYDARDTVLRAERDADVLSTLRLAIKLRKAEQRGYYDAKREHERASGGGRE